MAYVEAIPAFIEKQGWRYIVRGVKPTVMEGDWRPERMVILEFPARANAELQQVAARMMEEYPVTNTRMGAGLTPLLIEGLEAVDHDWVVGVQWHPERHEAEAPESDPNILLLSAFAERVREFAAS